MASVMLIGGLRPRNTSSLVNSILRMSASIHAASAQVDENVSWDNARPYDEIPGPKPLPLIGNLHHFIPGIGDLSSRDLLEQQKYLQKKYGKIVKLSGIPGRDDIVFVYDAKYVEEMFRNEGQWPHRDILQCLEYYRKVYRKDFFEGVGGVLVDQGEKWKKFRSTVNPPMMQPRVAHLYLKPITEVTNDLITRTKSLRNTMGEMPGDYMNELFKWALESIAMIALDHRLGCLEPNMKPDSEPQKMINAVNDFFAGVEVMELRPPLWKILSTPTWRRFARALDYFTDVSMKHINNAIERMKKRKPGEDYEPSVLEKLLQRDPNPKTACVMAIDMLIAGVDTTSFTSASLMYHLANNQDKQQYLFDEISKFLAHRNDEITMEMLDEMKYLKACMKESMRMSGIVTAIMRGTVKDTVIGNYRIPKGVNVLMSQLIFGKMEEYNPMPSRFIPERWLKDRPGTDGSVGSAEDYNNVKDFKTNPFSYLPFGFGPRMCVGKRFAELEFAILIIKMVRHFHIEYNYGEMEFSSRLLHKPADPLKFKLTDRVY